MYHPWIRASDESYVVENIQVKVELVCMYASNGGIIGVDGDRRIAIHKIKI